MGEAEYPLHLQLPTRRARVFFVRHGEPDVYGEDTPLTENGVHQVEEFADQFADILAGDKRSKLVKILRSDRLRTGQTARVIEGRVRNKLKAHELANVELKRNIPVRKFIAPDNTIDAVLSQGVSLSDAYNIWIYLGRDDAAKIGAKWSGEVASEAFGLTSKLGGYINEVPEGPDLYYVLATHETTLGAILLHADIEGTDKIRYAQHIEMEPVDRDVLVKSGNAVSVVHLRSLENGISQTI